MDQARRIAPLLASTAVSVAGDGVFLTAAPLLAASLSRNPVAVSVVTAAFYLPWLLIGLPAGVLVDRWHRRSVMVAADATRAALLTALCVLIAAERIDLLVLTLVVVAVGAAQTFFDAAAQAYIPSVVGRNKDVLARVNGRFWALDTIGRSLLGPPFGSLLFSVRQAFPFAADALSFLASAGLVRLLPAVPPVYGPHESVRNAIGSGLRHVGATAGLRVLAAAAAAYNFAYSVAIATFVLYASDVLHVSSALYGLLLASAAAGGAVAGWQARILGRRLTHAQIMVLATLGQATGWLGIAVTGNAWVAGATLALIGGCNSLGSVAVASARQVLTPDALLGRVFTAFRLFSLGASGAGAIAGGLVADQLGLPAPLFVAAGLLFVTGLGTIGQRTAE